MSKKCASEVGGEIQSDRLIQILFLLMRMSQQYNVI